MSETDTSPEFDKGEDLGSVEEAWDELTKRVAENWATNQKLTYDTFLNVVQTAAVRSQSQFDAVQNVSLQALQNAVETANMIGKQAVAHRDIAINEEWNLDPSEGAAEAAVLNTLDIEAIVTAVVAQALAKMANQE